MASVDKLTAALQNMELAIDEYTDDRLFSDIWGWQAPPLNYRDLSFSAQTLRLKFEALDFSDAGEDDQGLIDDLVEKTEKLKATHVPNLFSGERAADAILTFLYSLEVQMGAIFAAGDIKGVLVLPNDLKRNVAAAEKRLAQAVDGLGEIEEKLEQILAAHKAAADLPVTTTELEEALRLAESARDGAVRHETATKETSDEAIRIINGLNSVSEDAGKILEKVNAAYRAATSEGLARSFSEKASNLSASMLFWAFLLLLALGSAGYLSYLRFPAILQAATGNPQWGTVLVHSILGILTVGPALWLAWVSTMQIGQRFRLSEDYGYKASLAAAYEGYRAEAANLDPVFTAQLFSIALSRLDELPIRLIDRHVAGSPLHELLKTAEFREALDKVPKLKERLVEVVKAATPGTAASAEKSESKEEQPP